MIPVKYCIQYEKISTVKECEVIVNKYPDYDHDGMHSHTFIEVAYVSEGSGWHVIGNQIFRCGPGDLYIINVGDPHFWMSENDTPLTIHNLIFRPGFFDITLLGKSNFSDVMGSFLLESFSEENYFDSLYVHFDENEQPNILRLFDSMLNEYNAHERGFLELVRSWTIELLVIVFRKKNKDQSHKRVIKEAATAALSPVFEYINEYYMKNISLTKLASLAYLSPTYLSRVFKESTGSTVTEYIQQKRIYRAMELLQTTDNSIASIAAVCGYTDVKHFTRLFKRIINCSPSEYRTKIRKSVYPEE